ncbi:MAG: NUDIX domain-containing protein [Xanthobacteraceae bacterium]
MKKFLPERAAKAVIVSQDKVLVLEKALSALDPTTDDASGLDLPGGRALPDETYEEALVREVLEETGLAVEPIELIEEWQITVDTCVLRGRTYLCAVTGGQLCVSSTEHRGSHWLSANEIPPTFSARSACVGGLRALENTNAQQSGQ